MGQPAARTDDRRFFTAAAIFLALLVFAGFSHSYYLHTLFRVAAPSTFLEFHGALMTGWILLLLLQTVLISVRRTVWHKRLGVAGAIYAALIIPIGCVATLSAAQREVRAHSSFMSGQLNVLGLEFTQLALFGCFIAAALWLRNRTDFHKRLMVLATLCIVPNAIVRLALLSGSDFWGTNLAILTVWTLMVLSIVATDSLRSRRLHPAFGWGACVAIGALYLAWWG